jgi:hypothetical protein
MPEHATRRLQHVRPSRRNSDQDGKPSSAATGFDVRVRELLSIAVKQLSTTSHPSLASPNADWIMWQPHPVVRSLRRPILSVESPFGSAAWACATSRSETSPATCNSSPRSQWINAPLPAHTSSACQRSRRGHQEDVPQTAERVHRGQHDELTTLNVAASLIITAKIDDTN